jgi:hypothetical protein
MWTTFGPDLLVAVIGAVIGSVLTVLIAAVTFFVQRRRTEIGTINVLIDDIHHRRAFTVDNPQRIPEAVFLPDYDRANRSVLDIRDRIRESRARIRPQVGQQSQLSKMLRACNRYLENSSELPAEYWFGLEQLRSDLWESIVALAESDSSIIAREPGGAAF